MKMLKRGFASDNNSGIHPEVLAAIQSANHGHCAGYGDDPYTTKAVECFKKHFGDQAQVFFTFNGSGANVLALQAMCRSYHAVICAQTAHIQVDECGAPEKFFQGKLLPVDTPDGKLTPELIKPHLTGFGFEHHIQPKAISITQVTELGTCYTVDELKALRDIADEYDLLIHMDGARLCNAAAYLNLPLKAFTTEIGVDVLVFGGTKNGLMLGEAVVILNPALAKDFKYIRKQSAQLASKMRFISAQFIALLEKNLWLENASHANRMAQRFAEKIKDIPGVTVTQHVESNGLFVQIPKEIIAPLQEQYFFYSWDEVSNIVRWLCSFDTTAEDVDAFVIVLKGLCS